MKPAGGPLEHCRPEPPRGGRSGGQRYRAGDIAVEVVEGTVQPGVIISRAQAKKPSRAARGTERAPVEQASFLTVCRVYFLSLCTDETS